MADHDPHAWQRLADHVIARRVQLGYKKRPAFSEVSGISIRILGDIETGRRGNFDPTTIAALENTLRWETGSVNRIIDGADPVLRGDTPAARTRPALTGYNTDEDEALIRVMRSTLPDAKKRQLVQMLIAEREEADRQRAARAEQLIQFFGDGQ